MFGFIVTTHYNNFQIIKKCLDLLFCYIPENYYVLLYVNETTCDNVLNIKNNYVGKNLEVFYIDDQEKNNGLTGTWNKGINYLLDLKCNVITILGHDTYINKNIKYLLDAAIVAENNKDLLYFGPLYKNYPGKNDELWQDEYFYKNYQDKFIIGSLLTFPKNSLINNKIDKTTYFNEIKYPFGYNDIEWYERFIKIGGKPKIITECIIDHKYQRTWVNVDRNLKAFLNNNNNNIIDNIEKLFENKIKDLKFNWKQYLRKNVDLQHKGIITEKDALNHYLTKGKYENRPH